MDFTEKLRLREKAIEDLYFAEVDRKLIEALHENKINQCYLYRRSAMKTILASNGCEYSNGI